MNNDLISRSALLQELKEQHDYIMQDPEVGKTMKWCESVCFHRTVETVESAPAVDAEKVFEQMGLVKEAFEMAKAGLAPVVQCKDFVHRYEMPDGWSLCNRKMAGMIHDSDFCSYGEKRADRE